MKSIQDLKIKIFADGADLKTMIGLYKQGLVKGFTTNPTLMRQAGVQDYEIFAKEVLKEIRDLPISFEVFSDDFASMEREARKIASWGKNVNVKIPITNTKGESSAALIKKLAAEGLTLNITAILTLEQVSLVSQILPAAARAIVSVFAGRIADTANDPVPLMTQAAQLLKSCPHAELLWASSRELLNIFQAEECGCHIITVTPDILKKIPQIGRDLTEYSLGTVRAFYQDAQSAGYKI